MTTAQPWASSSNSVVVGAPWASSDSGSLAQFLATSGDKSRAGLRDDDTFAESVLTMMLPDSLTAGQLRSRRENLMHQQEMRKLNKKISEKSRELRRLRSRGDKLRVGYAQQQRTGTDRQESAKDEWEKRLERLPYDDSGMEFITTALEQASVEIGRGSFEAQKEQMSEEEQMQFDVQILQEAQLVRQMQQMHVTGQQRFLHKKHDQREIEYLKSCGTWLSDHDNMIAAVQKMEKLVEEMRVLYVETLRRQEAAFARHDADMTIRETIEDLF